MMNLDGVELEAFQFQTTLNAIYKFVDFANRKDSEYFRHIVSPSGLIAIRNFVSGNGTRGKDIRTVYSADQIPSNLEFAVQGEVPVVIDNLFPTSIKSGSHGIKRIKIVEKSFDSKYTVNSSITEPSTSEVWELCREIQKLTSDK